MVATGNKVPLEILGEIILVDLSFNISVAETESVDTITPIINQYVKCVVDLSMHAIRVIIVLINNLTILLNSIIHHSSNETYRSLLLLHLTTRIPL